MLKIKEGSSIQPIGPTGETYTSETPLPQDILEHLQTRYPEDIEEDEPKEKKQKK